MNFHAVQAIYKFEMSRWLRTIGQSLFSPVLSTSLYFIVFGSAIGSRMVDIGGVSYGALWRVVSLIGLGAAVFFYLAFRERRTVAGTDAVPEEASGLPA